MKVAAFSESFGQRIKNVVEMFDPQDVAQPTGNKAAILSGYSAPMQITGAWELDQELWKCKAKRLWKSDGRYQTRENATEINLYAPCDDATPTPGIGDKVFAVFRGVWEMVGGGGSSKVLGVIMSVVKEPPLDLTAEDYNAMFAASCGTVKIIGKTYTADEDGNINYDKVTCYELAHTEVLGMGRVVYLESAGVMPVDPPDPESTDPVPDPIPLYAAVETDLVRGYSLPDDLSAGETFTVTVDENEMMIYSGVLTPGMMLPKWSEVFVGRVEGVDADNHTQLQLKIIKSPCPEPVE